MLRLPVAAKLVDNKTKEHWFVHCYTNELTDNKTLFCHSEPKGGISALDYSFFWQALNNTYRRDAPSK